jgi:adenine-specific DNA-methyltransferase
MDEVVGDGNFISLIAFVKTQALGAAFLPGAYDYLVWFAKDKQRTKFRPLLTQKSEGIDLRSFAWVSEDNISASRLPRDDAGGESRLEHRFRADNISRQEPSEIGGFEFEFEGRKYDDVKNFSQIWAVAPALVKLALRDVQQGQTDKEPPWKRIAKGPGLAT